MSNLLESAIHTEQQRYYVRCRLNSIFSIELASRHLSGAQNFGVIHRFFKICAPPSKGKHTVSITKINQLMLHMETIAVCSKFHIKL